MQDSVEEGGTVTNQTEASGNGNTGANDNQLEHQVDATGSISDIVEIIHGTENTDDISSSDDFVDVEGSNEDENIMASSNDMSLDDGDNPRDEVSGSAVEIPSMMESLIVNPVEEERQPLEDDVQLVVHEERVGDLVNDIVLDDADDGDDEEEGNVYLDMYDEDEGIEIIQETDEGDNTDDESSEDEEVRNNKKNTTFDMSLPNSHSYMGENMEELKGRTIHAEGEIVMMPLFFQPGVVLVPGQTLPLNLFHPQPISMMKKVIAADKTFGLMMTKGNRSSDQRNSFASVGVTCEIYSVREDSVYGVDQMSLKGEGRQRFRILSKQFQLDGVIMGKILILPDAPIPPYPRMSLIYSHHHHNAISSQVMAHNFYVQNERWKFGETRYMKGFNQRDLIVLCRSTAALPGWVYKLYNPYFLMDCLMNEISSWNSNLRVDEIPIDATGFSHWITANLPLTNEMKIELLEIDSAVLRLRRQIELMNKCTTTLACNGCQTAITDKAELFCLSRKGPMAAYVNPGGHVHETVTFYKAKNLTLRGRSSTEYSWFPGYAWTIAECKKCRQHMGWKFTADKKGLEPTKFWGLTRTGLKPVFKNVEDSLNTSVENEDFPSFSSVMYESNI